MTKNAQGFVPAFYFFKTSRIFFKKILDCFSDNHLNYSIFIIIFLFSLLFFLVDTFVEGERGLLFRIYISKIFLNFKFFILNYFIIFLDYFDLIIILNKIK